MRSSPRLLRALPVLCGFSPRPRLLRGLRPLRGFPRPPSAIRGFDSGPWDLADASLVDRRLPAGRHTSGASTIRVRTSVLPPRWGSDRGDAHVSISGLSPGAKRCHPLWGFGIDRHYRRKDAKTNMGGASTSIVPERIPRYPSGPAIRLVSHRACKATRIAIQTSESALTDSPRRPRSDMSPSVTLRLEFDDVVTISDFRVVSASRGWHTGDIARDNGCKYDVRWL